MSKKFLFFVILFHLVNFDNLAFSEIIPLKKPIQTKEETQKKLLIDVLKPLAKPIKKTETKKVEKEIVVEKKIINGLIIPKKKPLIAGSKKKNRSQDIKIL